MKGNIKYKVLSLGIKACLFKKPLKGQCAECNDLWAERVKVSGWGWGGVQIIWACHDKEFSFIPVQWEAMEMLKEEKQGMISCMN